MALMAVLRSSSRWKASRLDFWTKKSRNASDTKTATMIISRTVKPDFVFIIIIITQKMVVPGGIEPPTSGL